MTPFNLETTAYAILEAAGIEEYIPYVHGWAKRSPVGWGLSSIDGDAEGEYYGILMEWLEGAEQLSIKNVTIDNAITLTNGLSKIHEAGILHFDTFERNMLVIPGTIRGIWIDFSCAQVGNERYHEQEMYSGGAIPIELVIPTVMLTYSSCAIR